MTTLKTTINGRKVEVSIPNGCKLTIEVDGEIRRSSPEFAWPLEFQDLRLSLSPNEIPSAFAPLIQ